MNGPQTLALVVERALQMGAVACYIEMRQGIGQIVFNINNRLEKVSTISPKVFADCNAVLLPYLHLQGVQHAPLQSGLMGFRSQKGPVQVLVRSHMHVEPLLSLQFTPEPLTPISFAQLNLSGPASLAIRQYLATSQRLMFLTSDQLGTSQTIFMQALAATLGLFSRQPILYSGTPLPISVRGMHTVAVLDAAAKAAPEWSEAIILENNFTDQTAALLSQPPQPKKVVMSAGQPLAMEMALPQIVKSLHQFSGREAYLPALPVYVQAMPRLCYRCRKPINLNMKDYQWLQSKLTGVVERNYTTPELPQTLFGEPAPGDAPKITHLQEIGVTSLLDLIARDPGMVNRSADERLKQQTEVKTKSLWEAGKQPTCPVCRGTGYDGYLLSTGFAEISLADFDDAGKLADDTRRLTGRFWVDVFDKVENGLLSIQHVAHLAVQADAQNQSVYQAVPGAS